MAEKKNYKIVFHDGRDTLNLTFDEAIEYKIENLKDKDKFTLVPPKTREKKEDKDEDDGGYRDFMRSLNETQKLDLEHKRVKVCKSEEGNWYLKQKSDDEIHITLTDKKIRAQRLRDAIKSHIGAWSGDLYASFMMEDGIEVSLEEFEQYLSNITFVIKEIK